MSAGGYCCDRPWQEPDGQGRRDGSRGWHPTAFCWSRVWNGPVPRLEHVSEAWRLGEGAWEPLATTASKALRPGWGVGGGATRWEGIGRERRAVVLPSYGPQGGGRVGAPAGCSREGPEFPSYSAPQLLPSDSSGEETELTTHSCMSALPTNTTRPAHRPRFHGVC